ncbi:hypothetical protein DFH09DRAFT_1445941 [Mycena vulgaris]|nr:hypothetical protein DFH09DRAFT_1445941 [Mycena vulgaris]
MASKIAALKEAIEKSPPICSGTCEIPAGQNILVYGLKEDGSARWTDLAKATPEQLDTVSAACQRATFGLNGEDVLDETYRRAGQMSAKDFSIGFNLEKSGILDSVHEQLLAEFDDKGLDAELYKLNIYDKGSFFKAHKDTPRGENMFGSLVIVFPTFHVGGALLLRHNNKEQVFDSARILAPFDASKLAYVAFYGDVEHEVAPVESGHRVTLTYNLYFHKPQALLCPNWPLPLATIFWADALLIHACKNLGLDTMLKAVYSLDDGTAMLDTIPQMDNDQIEGSVLRELLKSYGGEVIDFNGYEWDDSAPDVTDITWITPMSNLTSFKTAYIHYGNEASLGYIYGDLALMVDVPAAGIRM